MKKETKFYLSEGLMLLSFAFGSEMHILASIMASILSLLVAIDANSFAIFKKKIVFIIGAVVLEFCLINYTNLLSEVPTIVFLITCNTSVALLWMESEYESIDSGMKIILFFMTLLYILNTVINNARFPFIDMFVYITIIFMPSIIAYTYKCIKEISRAHDFEKYLN